MNPTQSSAPRRPALLPTSARSGSDFQRTLWQAVVALGFMSAAVALLHAQSPEATLATRVGGSTELNSGAAKVGAGACPGFNGPLSDLCLNPAVVALAEELDHDPLKIYLHVRNNYRYQVYEGLLKGPQATIETGRGNDYDLAALTGALLAASGYSLRWVEGFAKVSPQAMVEWLGLEDAAAAVALLNPAGISATPVPESGEVDHYRVQRFWLQVRARLRPGDELEWFPLDPAFKKHDLSPGIPGLLSSVPFDEEAYLSESRRETAQEFYSQQLSDYIGATLPGRDLADAPLRGVIREENLSRLPRSLPFGLASTPSYLSLLNDSGSHTATLRLKYGPTITTFSYRFVLPVTSLKRVTVSYRVYPPHGPIVDGYGGLANTPPGAVDVVPELRLDGEIVADGDRIPYLNVVEFDFGFTRKTNGQDGPNIAHRRRAGERVAIGLDAAQTSEKHLERQARTIVDAIALQDSGGSPESDDLIGALLYLAIMQWHMDNQSASEILADLTHFKRWHHVNYGIAFANQEVFSVDGVPFTSLPGTPMLDIRRWTTTDFALDNDNTLKDRLRWIHGYNGSALEHAVWERLINVPAMSTVKSLQVANERGIAIWTINEFDSDTANDCVHVLCPLLDLDPDTVANVTDLATGANGVTKTVVIVPRAETPLNNWNGVGYIAASSGMSPLGFLLAGGISLTSGDLPLEGGSLNGGASTVTLEDGTTLAVPPGHTGTDGSFVGDPVNVANGNFYHEETDFSMPWVGEPFAFRRYYNSMSTVDVGFGPGWTHEFSDRLVGRTWITSHGTAYDLNDPATLVELRATLVQDPPFDYLRFFDGRELTFLSGNLVLKDDRNGNRVHASYEYDYDNGDRLDSVVVSPTRGIQFGYDAAGSRIETVTDDTGRVWHYGYDAGGRLDRVTSPSDAETPAMVMEYTYDSSGRLATITEPNGGTRQLRYYANGQTAEVIDPCGGVMTLVYNPYKMETAVTDARGQRSVYGYNDRGNQTTVTHPDGSVDRWTWVGNRVTSHTDPLGNIETFEYYADGSLERVTDATAIATGFEYEPPYSNLTRVTRPGGRASVLDYDANGNLSMHTDGEGHVWRVVHNSRGLPETVTDARDHTTTYVYNRAGQWTSMTTELPSTETRDYFPRGTLERWTDANGKAVAFAYDLLDRPLTMTDGENNTTTFTYDAAGRLTTVTDPRGYSTTLEYDLNDRVVLRTAADGTSTRFEYDAVGNLVAESDALGRSSRVRYDARGRPVRLTGPDGSVLKVGYDGAGRIRSITDPLGNTSHFEYDDAGRLTARIDPAGKRAELTHDANGNVETFLDRRGGLTTYEYDALNRITEVRGPENQIRTADYDPNGNLEQVVSYDVLRLGEIPDDPRTLPSDRKRIQTNAYDLLDRLQSSTDPEGQTTRIVYHPNGNVEKVIDERSNETRAEYDEANRLKKIIRPDLSEVRIGYDAAGNRTSLTTPRGGSYTWAHDSRNRISTVTDPKGRVTSFEYDVVGNPTARIHHDGTWVKQIYDPADRPVLLRRSDGSFTSSAYDAAGNLVRTRTEKTSLELTYDALHRLTHETLTFLEDGFSKTTGYGYDDEGGLTRVTDPEGRTIDYLRDLAGRIQTVTDLAGPHARIAHNGYSEVANIVYGNGTLGRFDHDKNGRLKEIDWTDSILSLDYLRDPAGNPETVNEVLAGLSEVLTLDYDALNRPLSVTAQNSPGTRSETFDYDLNDNLRDPGNGSTSTFDVADQLIGGLAGAYFFDTRGNRSSVDDGTTRIETPHDPSNRTTAIRRSVGGVTDHDVTMTRDGLGRLVEIRSGSGVRRILHAFANRLVEYDGPGNVDVSYTMTDGLDDVLAIANGTTTQYIHRDGVNSVRAVTDASGAATGWRDFGQFGRVLASGGAFDSPLGFTGRPFDAATGLIDLRARFMDPSTGTFLGRDPIGLSLNLPNPFTYAANRPRMFIDPLGLFPVPDFPTIAPYNPERGVPTGNPLTFNAGFDPFSVAPPGSLGAQLTALAAGFGVGAAVGYYGTALLLANPVAAAVVGVGGAVYLGYQILQEFQNDFEGIRGFGHSVKNVFTGNATVGEAFEVGLVTGTLAGAARYFAARTSGMSGTVVAENTAARGGANVGPKVANQMGPRGWTREAIDEAIKSGDQIKAIDKATGNPATRYVHPQTGQSVVVDNVTKEVIHVGGPGFKYGPGSGDLP